MGGKSATGVGIFGWIRKPVSRFFLPARPTFRAHLSYEMASTFLPSILFFSSFFFEIFFFLRWRSSHGVGVGGVATEQLPDIFLLCTKASFPDFVTLPMTMHSDFILPICTHISFAQFFFFLPVLVGCLGGGSIRAVFLPPMSFASSSHFSAILWFTDINGRAEKEGLTAEQVDQQLSLSCRVTYMVREERWRRVREGKK